MVFGGPAPVRVSPILAAGILLISTVVLPIGQTSGPWGLGGNGTGQAWVSDPARQAGNLPMSTLELPGPGASGVPCAVVSVILAAGFPIVLVDLDETPLDLEDPA